MKIAFLGDVAFLGQFNKQKNRDVENKLLFLKSELEKYDFVIANLESPLTKKKSTMVCKSMHLKADPCNVDLLKYLNVSAVSLANNHIADYGKRGIQETIETLENAGIQWFGVGNKALELLIGGEKINVSGFCCYSTNGTHYGGKTGVHILTLENVQKQLERDEERGAFSVMMIHWGLEHTNYPAYEHLALARKILNQRKAIICGHHPHIVQGIERVDNSLVAYSLGNAIFDACISRNGKLKLELNENNRKGFILGGTIENGQLAQYTTTGFYIGNKGIVSYDIDHYLEKISASIKNIEDIGRYEIMRRNQFNKVIKEKFGKHDLKWLLNRLNYYAIGSRLMTSIRGKKYRQEAERFVNG